MPRLKPHFVFLLVFLTAQRRNTITAITGARTRTISIARRSIPIMFQNSSYTYLDAPLVATLEIWSRSQTAS